MIEPGPQMIVDGPSITKMRLKMIAFGCEMIICKTDKIVSAPQIIISVAEIIIS